MPRAGRAQGLGPPFTLVPAASWRRPNDQAIQQSRSALPKRAEAERPAPDVTAALALSPRAKEAFAALAPSHRREYLAWIGEARRQETRHRRIESMIEKLQHPGGR